MYQPTDAGDDDDMTVLSCSHVGKYGFDDVHVGEEVDLEDLIHKTYCSAALSQLLHGADYSCENNILAEVSGTI